MYYRFPKSYYLDVETRTDLDIEKIRNNCFYRSALNIEAIIDEEYADEIVTIM